MVEIFLISHEDVSVSLLRSAELILGIQNHVYTYSLKRGEDIETFGETISKKIEELNKQKAEQDKETQSYIIEQAKESDKVEGKNLLTIDFRVTATKEQFMAIREFFEKNNIKYGRI